MPLAHLEQERHYRGKPNEDERFIIIIIYSAISQSTETILAKKLIFSYRVGNELFFTEIPVGLQAK